MAKKEKKNKKVKQGTVVSVKNTNTVIVRVEKLYRHPLYKKAMKKTKRYAVDTDKELKIGDVVGIVSSKPISKTKKWKIYEVISKSK